MSQIKVGLRSGDTPQKARQAMLRQPPHILLTTPESLYLMLTSPKAREIFRMVQPVIVDEILPSSQAAPESTYSPKSTRRLIRCRDSMFLNRKNELADLESRYNSERAEFVVLWGRRRVGKTSLIWAFCQDKPYVFYFSERASGEYLLRAFSQHLRAAFEPEATIADNFSYTDWYTAFQQMAQLAIDQRLTIVIDEFPYLAESVPGVSTALQKAWDLHLSKSKIFLVLTGSTLSVMSRHVLDASAPLYGRHS